MLKLAIQKSGRLSENSLRLLQEMGIEFKHETNKLRNESLNFPLEILFLRDDDIPQYVEDGVADLGIIGENIWLERTSTTQKIKELGFGKCRLSFAVPKEIAFEDLTILEGKRIATTYPNIVQNFLNQRNIKADIHEISGSVEIAPSLGLAEVVCDIVSTGNTLTSNGLKEVATLLQSQAILIASKDLASEKRQLLEKLLFRLESASRAKGHKYILLNAPISQVDQISSILPGMKSPTILPLSMEGWCSIHSVIAEKDFWENIQLLKEAGAEGILVVPIEKMIL